MDTFKITYQMTMKLKANSEQDALETFESMTFSEIGAKADTLSVKRVENTNNKH